MASESYSRFVVTGFNVVVKALVVGTCMMWFITLADLLLGLGWGWDRQSLWLAPIIAVLGMVVLLGGNAIFRLLGAASTKR